MAMNALCQRLEPLLKRSDADKRPVALMTCGVAGSTFARAVIQNLPTFQRLSIDGIIASRHGMYGVDYPKSEYGKFQDEADGAFREAVEQILEVGKEDFVLDRSFCAKEDRALFKGLIEQRRARWVLVYLKVPKEVLWQRICDRREAGVNADSALEISKELLNVFFEGFEVPHGEGEVVVENDTSLVA